jgi:xylulose-5-phosphate/fructose-6-phosphate phosphoketolase
VGHWGCNPGIAWAVAHLAAVLRDPDPFLLVVGTGHATSFLFAHDAIAKPLAAGEISTASRWYGQPGGEPTELIGLPEIPFASGELGPGLAVAQGLAVASSQRLVVAVIGDGECETPAALAALAHRDVLLRETPSRWLPVINANGARMGGVVRFSAAKLERLLSALGYEVVRSGADGKEAARAAAAAVSSLDAGRPAVWISETEKGWPAPAMIGSLHFRGHRAHKPAALVLDDEEVRQAVQTFVDGIATSDLFDATGVPAPDIVATARRAALRLPTLRKQRQTSSQAPMWRALAPWQPMWRPPIDAVDTLLARRGTSVLSPDEAASNRLGRSMQAGLVREVLAEEICSAWTWGCVEGGQECAFVSYEAFAPLVSSQIAQYAKMIHARPPAGRPPFLVLLTSLGWGNSPTHQNSDLAGTVLARPSSRLRLVCPFGASSAERRIEQILSTETDTLAVVICSKQPLLDVPDPGAPLVQFTISGAREPQALLIAVGDVCITEAIGAMTLAAGVGIAIGVVAVADIGRLRWLVPDGSVDFPQVLVGVGWCAPAFLESVLWQFAGRLYPVAGYAECWGATAWETLCANGMDRISLLESLAVEGCPLPVSLISEARDLCAPRSGAPSGGVPSFSCPQLTVVPVPVEDREARTSGTGGPGRAPPSQSPS